MPSAQLTLSTTPTLLPLDEPANRVIVTMQESPEEVFVTTDGSYPQAPSGITDTNVGYVPAVVGGYTVVHVPQHGDHLFLPTVRLASASGSPTVSVQW